MLYRVDGKKAPELLREYGPDYEEKLIKQIVRTSVRDAIAEMESSVVYQERTKLQEKIKREVGSQLMKRYLILEDVLIRDLRLPESVVRAIEEKRKAYEEAQRMQFLLEKEKLEAERKKVEAQGIAEANRIIAGSLTKEYLTWKFIENIQEYAKSPNNTVIKAHIPYGKGDHGSGASFISNITLKAKGTKNLINLKGKVLRQKSVIIAHYNFPFPFPLKHLGMGVGYPSYVFKGKAFAYYGPPTIGAKLYHFCPP